MSAAEQHRQLDIGLGIRIDIANAEADALARGEYDRFCTSHRERSPYESMPSWEQLTAGERLHFAALAEGAYWQVRGSMTAHREAMTMARASPQVERRYAPPSREQGVGEVTVTVGGAKPACTCKLHDDAGRPKIHKRSCPRWTREDADWVLSQWQDARHLPTNPGPLPADAKVPDQFVRVVASSAAPEPAAAPPATDHVKDAVDKSLEALEHLANTAGLDDLLDRTALALNAALLALRKEQDRRATKAGA